MKEERSKKHKSKSDKKEKKSKHSKEKKHKKSHKKRGHDDDSIDSADHDTISSEDYFLKSEEFRVWLKLDRKKSFEDIDSALSHKLFEDFCKLWNESRLPDMYYSGIPPEIRQECMKTKHNWGLKLSSSEKAEVSDLADRVDIHTRKRFDNAWNHMAAPKEDDKPRGNNSSSKRPSRDAYDREEEREKASKYRKMERRNERERVSVVLDEVAPKETGREALIDKRREAGSRMRAAAMDKEDGQDGLNMRESDVMGGGDDFASVKARIERGRERREEKKTERLRELQEKERERQTNFLNQLGLDKVSGPIRIAPRED